MNQAFTINPVAMTNQFVNCTVKSPFAQTKKAKLQFGVNNLMDSHAVTGVAGVTNGSTSAKPNPADLLNVLSGRSVNVTLTLDF